jgi:hypothetical protein
MKAPPRYHQVLSDSRWQAAFGRQSTVERVLDYVIEHWNKLQLNPPADMRFSNAEPKITKYFGHSLRKNALAHGITGVFQPEADMADIDEVKQELAARGRTDISYYSDRIDPPLDFVFEFKKMKDKPGGNESRREYCKSGVMRFVNAVYARGADIGFMVGLVDKSSDEKVIADALKRAIQHPDMVRLLRMIKHPDGGAISSSNLVFKQCGFETRHARDHVPRQDVLLGHLILHHAAPSTGHTPPI